MSDPPHQEPVPYNYAYGVRDDYAGTDFGHNEISDGATVTGSYTVQLPDGRKQTVSPELLMDFIYMKKIIT